jgi:hypothetical protein
MVGELAARHVADVQLYPGAVVRRIGHAVAAPRAVAQDEFNVLPRVVAEGVVGRQLQLEHHHVMRHLFQRDHTRGHLLDGKGAFVGHLARLDQHVGLRHGAARQDEARSLFLRAQRLDLVRAMDDRAFQLPALARPTGAVLATIGQADALADGRRQDGLVRVGGECAPAGLHGDLERHSLGILGPVFADTPRFCPQTKAPSAPGRPAFAAHAC